jgi:hypothetical protein
MGPQSQSGRFEEEKDLFKIPLYRSYTKEWCGFKIE